ncbi:MAG: RibD family protein [Caldimonas manganoxidans]|nr:RibD family protein [Caldimonas manganoxidans]
MTLEQHHGPNILALGRTAALACEALWPLLLQAADWRRRQGAGPAPRLSAAHDPRLGMHLHDGQWQLHGAWPLAAHELAGPLLPLVAEVPAGTSRVVGQLGQSLDGQVATQGGDSGALNGPEALVHLHRLRALSDAVLVGTGTAVADNPRLTTRHVSGPHPTRVVLDVHLRVPPEAGVFTDGLAPTLLVCDAHDRTRAAQRVGEHQVLAVPGLVDAAGQVVWPALLASLRERGLAVLLVEGGGVTVSRCLAQGVLDRLHLMVAPVLIGQGRPGVQLPPVQQMSQCLRPRARAYRLGEDVLWDLDLRSA